MSNILVVDDEPEIAETIMDYLTGCGHTVSICLSAEEALTALNSKEIQLILSDIKMPKMNGVDFYKEYKSKTNPTARFVLMTGHADLMNVQNAYELGVDELLAKPFDLDVLKLVVDYLLESEEAYGSSDEKYFAISIDDFMSSNHQEYSLFLKLNHKYMCVTKTGQEFTSQRLQNLANKGVKYVYLNSTDYAKYTDLQFVTTDHAKIRAIENANKIKAHKQLVTNALAHPILQSIDKNQAKRIQNSLSNYTQAIFNHPRLSDIYLSFLTEAPLLAEKNALTALICSGIAEQWKWGSPRIQSRIILGALLCDIGMKDSKELLSKKRFQYSVANLKELEAHPTKSHQILSDIERLPEEILHIALQHHEDMQGQGFPNKPARGKIHSFAKLVHGVSEFVETLYTQPTKNNPRIAVDQLVSFQRKVVSDQVLKSLHILFNISIPKELEGVLLPDQTNRVL